MTQIGTLIEKDGQTYRRIGNRAILVELDENGQPLPIKLQVTRKEHEDGRVDVTVNVPCLQIVPEQKPPGQ